MPDDSRNYNNCEVEVFIEPKIRIKWLSKLITWNKLFTISHLRTKLHLEITPRGQNIPHNLTLSRLHLHDGKGYCFGLGKTFQLDDIKPYKSTRTESFKIVFPYSGQFWLDGNLKSESKNFTLITKQKTLEGIEGRGTIKDLIGKENSEKGYSCRMPIGALDILTVWLVVLTIGLLCFTAALIFF